MKDFSHASFHLPTLHCGAWTSAGGSGSHVRPQSGEFDQRVQHIAESILTECRSRGENNPRTLPTMALLETAASIR